MLSSLGHKIIAAFNLTAIAVLVAAGCSSSSGNDSSGKAAAQMVESELRLEAPFTEKRPKVRIEKKYTCHGENLSPPLSWSGPPEGTRSYAIIAQDVDHQSRGDWVHWVMYNIPADVTKLAEGIPTTTDLLPDGTTQGTNDLRTNGYDGPCPEQIVIPGTGQDAEKQSSDEPAHKYYFLLYALDTELGLAPGSTKAELVSAMEGHVLAQAETVGKFQLPVVSSYKQDQGQKILGSAGKLTSTSTPNEP